MGKFKVIFGLFLAFVTVAFLGCIKNPNLGGGKDKPEKGDYPDFVTTQPCNVTINYHLAGYAIPFEMYGENPYEIAEDGSVLRKDIEPLFRAFTDKNGRFDGYVTLPAIVEQVWLSSDATGSIGTVCLPIKANRLTFDQEAYLANPNSKAETGTGFNYPDDCKILGDWTDVYGTPAYLLGNVDLPTSFKSIVDKTFSATNHKFISQTHPELFSNTATTDLVLKEATKVKMTFMRSYASWKNAVGYYTYPTGTTPSPEQLTKIIAFPNVCGYIKVNSDIRAGALLAGDQIQLKYWNGTAFEDEFPAGVSVGFFIMSYWFADGNISVSNAFEAARDIRYSNPAFNKVVNGVQVQRSVAVQDPKSGLMAVGFEDNVDMNYTDAVFALDVENRNAITDVVPIPDAPATEVYTEYKGSLAFEDRWPEEGDYDMNDAVIYYKSRVYINDKNEVTKIVDEFTVRNNGAIYQNGFGYQFHKVDANAIKDVSYSSNVTSSFMKGAALEPDQNHPTIILSDALKQVVDQPLIVTTLLHPGVSYTAVVPPYNPFIIVKSNEGRGCEVHLSNYSPTALANVNLLGTKDDQSQPEKGIFYVSANKTLPFAIHIADYNFAWPREGERINSIYSYFDTWVATGKHADWYKYPNASILP